MPNRDIFIAALLGAFSGIFFLLACLLVYAETQRRRYHAQHIDAFLFDHLLRTRRVLVAYLEQRGCRADPNYTRCLSDINELLRYKVADVQEPSRH